MSFRPRTSNTSPRFFSTSKRLNDRKSSRMKPSAIGKSRSSGPFDCTADYLSERLRRCGLPPGMKRSALRFMMNTAKGFSQTSVTSLDAVEARLNEWGNGEDESEDEESDSGGRESPRRRSGSSSTPRPGSGITVWSRRRSPYGKNSAKNSMRTITFFETQFLNVWDMSKAIYGYGSVSAKIWTSHTSKGCQLHFLLQKSRAQLFSFSTTRMGELNGLFARRRS